MLPWHRFINKALDLIDKPQSVHKHFSFITYKNSIISTGWNNSLKTHPLAYKFGYEFPFLHSELDSITKLQESVKILKNCNIVNIRLGKFDNILLSRPCKNCQKLLISFGFKEIYYSNEWGKFERLFQ